MAFTFKRGDTFDISGDVLINGELRDLTGWTVRSQLRAKDPYAPLGTNQLICELVATITSGPSATVRLEAPDAQTKTWPLGGAYLDIQLIDPAGEKCSTPTLELTIIPGVTHD